MEWERVRDDEWEGVEWEWKKEEKRERVGMGKSGNRSRKEQSGVEK